MGRRSGLQNLQSRRMDKGRNRSSVSEIKSEIPPCKPPKAGSKVGPVPHANSPLDVPKGSAVPSNRTPHFQKIYRKSF